MLLRVGSVQKWLQPLQMLLQLSARATCPIIYSHWFNHRHRIYCLWLNKRYMRMCFSLRHDRVARVGGGREKMIVSAVSRHCGFYCVSCIPLRFAVIAFLAFHLWPTGDIQNSFAHHFLVPQYCAVVATYMHIM